MEFSTKAIEEMAKIMVTEMKRVETGDEGVMGLENKAREFLKMVGKKAMEEYLSREEEGGRKIRCKCGGEAEYRERREAVVVSVFGKVEYRRRYYVCEKCHEGQAPRDEEMGLEPGAVTGGLARLLGIAGVERGFEEGARLVKEFMLVEVSDNTVRKETEGFGELQEEEEKKEKKDSQDAAKLQERVQKLGEHKGRLYGSLDGAIIPLKQEWRELKCLAWYEVEMIKGYEERRHHAKKIGEQAHLQAKRISYACEMCEAEIFGGLLWATGIQRGADLCKEIVFVCDGAVWIWRLIEKYFPQAVQIVDWFHASEYLAPLAKAAFGDEAHAWLDQARMDLWEGRIAEIIAEAQRLGSQYSAAQPAAQDLISYYQHNEKRMQYALFRQQGYFIGSGTIESACKQIAGARLKLAGARWTYNGGVQTAKARAAWLSGTWDALALKRAALPLAS